MLSPVDVVPLFGRMQFRHEWRTYQRMVLELFDHRDPAQRTFHIVAPPGSGKTLLGLEISRRIGRPTVTFSPTTTIQEQWRDKVRMFLPGDPEVQAEVLAHVSTDPGRLGVLSSLTYQSLSTQTHARQFLARLGHQAWLEELLEAGRTAERAELHLRELETGAPKEYQRQVGTRASREKRALLRSGGVDLGDLLHANALDLIERIVAAGTGCILLDEAHHLLDYWAMILKHLIARLPDALVVGLTATPPASAEPEAMANYLTLVDGIDFEVPIPAVVRSGHLAPYQDLVFITEPTEDERAFVRSEHLLLDQAVHRAFEDDRFLPFVELRINRPLGSPSWPELLSEDFDVAVAGVRVLLDAGREIGDDVEVVPEMRTRPTIEDRLWLVRDWALHFLRLSPDPSDRAMLGDLRAALRTLGLTMTETGWRPSASPLDRVLAYSRSKVDAMVHVLAEESAAVGSELRAVVLTDFERSSATALRRLEGVLDPESGGSVQAIRMLVSDERTDRLDPIMVTGRTVLCDDDLAGRLIEEARRFLTDRGLSAAVDARAVGDGLAVVEGTGGAWAPRRYVACVTDLFERGVTRCLVGTRGLLAEGWDSLRLNTLVDLTTAGTFASVNQIRGRSIRLDPDRPRKVANNWDIVCLASEVEEGRRDLDRFAAKHRHTWGLGSNGRVIKGVAHVDERLRLLEGQPLRSLAIRSINQRSIKRARDREAAWEAWGVGRPYDNFEFRGTVLGGEDLRLRTAFTWQGALRQLLNTAIATAVFYALMIWVAIPEIWATSASFLLRAIFTGILLAAPLAIAAPLFWRYVKSAFLELPVDSFLADFGRAVAEGLRTTGVASASPEQVRVTETEAGAYEVRLDAGDRQVTEAFAAAFQDLFTPIVDQRYLITREEASLSGTFYGPIWYTIRRALRLLRRRQPIYHPVPDVFGRRRETADVFASAWRRWVGGGELIYTRTGEGMRILLRERAARSVVRAAQIEEWR